MALHTHTHIQTCSSTSFVTSLRISSGRQKKLKKEFTYKLLYKDMHVFVDVCVTERRVYSRPYYIKTFPCHTNETGCKIFLQHQHLNLKKDAWNICLRFLIKKEITTTKHIPTVPLTHSSELRQQLCV